jgi:hypothetical protein
MTLKDYYEILGLPVNSSVEEIKKAYRKKARLYHPDINPSPDAIDMFISATEAYEFLIANHHKLQSDDEAYNAAMEDWRKYRQDRSRRRATAYARTSYSTFKNTSFYKTTRIFDGTAILISFVISVIIILYTIFGYIFRLRNPIPGIEGPSVVAFIMLLLMGITFLVGSLVFFRAYQESIKKQKKKL